MNFAYLFKTIIVGDQSVGKSSLLLRFLHQEFHQDTEATIGVQFASTTIIINTLPIKLQIWDTAGQEAFQSITRSYYRGTAAAILVYDVTSRRSFNSIARWLNETKNYATTENLVMALVGNKIDLTQRQVQTEEGRSFAEKNGLLFFESSARWGKNVNSMFQKVTEEVLRRVQSGEISVGDQSGGVRLGDYHPVQTTQKKRCC